MSPLWIAAFFGLSEVAISTLLRAKADTKDADNGSLRLLWMVINFSMIAAIGAFLYFPRASFAGQRSLYFIALSLLAIGIALRWFSIAYLGRFFTVNVAIARDHRVIDTGPYRRIRHPSYTGALLAFLGIGLVLGNYVSLFLVTVPIVAVFLRRMQIEETALLAGLGVSYQKYMARTQRLIPFVY